MVFDVDGAQTGAQSTGVFFQQITAANSKSAKDELRGSWDFNSPCSRPGALTGLTPSQHLRYTRGVNPPPILLGTSSFTASGWAGSFYPKGMRPADYLSFYAEHFQAVEVDSTFYACPSVRTVGNWAARTPEGFTFAVKVPQSITHEKALAGCEAELTEFLKTMDVLGTKLGPIVFQFPFFNRSAFQDRHEFLDRLVPFLTKLPDGYKFAIEIRNQNWLDAEFANLLRDRRIALVLQDRSWMPNPAELKFDPITANWTYMRWLGDRKAIEQQTINWDKTVVDRSAELSSWVDFCYQLRKRGVLIYAFANNHYSLCRRRHNENNAAFRIMPNCLTLPSPFL
jgi:uncharacterized protein YecE (DUF72 family)